MERMVPINQPEAPSAARGLRQFVSFAPCLQRTPVFNLGEVRQRGRGACNRALPALDLRFRRWNNMTSPRGEPREESVHRFAGGTGNSEAGTVMKKTENKTASRRRTTLRVPRFRALLRRESAHCL